MRKIKLFLASVVLLATSCFSENVGLNVGDALPNPVISVINAYDENKTNTRLYDLKNDEVLLIVFMPDITLSNPAAKIITTGLDTYFAEGLSFRPFERYSYENPPLKVLVVTANPEIITKEQIAEHELNFDVISDESMDMANYFGINNWRSQKDASHVYIADKDNKIVYAIDDYKGEGEKLKDIQSKLFKMFGLNENLSDNKYPALILGEKARDFDFEYINNLITEAGTYSSPRGKLSDYFGKKNVLLAFYPAPYSYSCAAEVTRFDTYAQEKLIEKVGSAPQDDLELLMVSVSNNYILEKWKKDMNLNNIKLVNDPGGEISMKYNSYNQLGWNKRTVFLINKEGVIQYIDWDYNVDNDEDFGVLRDQIMAAN